MVKDLKSKISSDIAIARYYSGRGAPFSVIVYKVSNPKPVLGALSYEN